MPSRRPHTKTRSGCNTCKARKVRCDEEKPVCRNCTRGGRQCSYSEQVFTFSAKATGGALQVFPIRDMELLHHYTCYSYRTMTLEMEQYDMWQIEVPKLAFSHRYLLHGLLSVAALHMHQLTDDSDKASLLEIARYHQQHALTLYIPLLRTIDLENCHPLFCFSIVLAAMTFGLLQSEYEPDTLIPRFLDCVDTLMGATAIALQHKEWLLAGPFGFLLTDWEPGQDNHTDLPEGLRKALADLLSSADNICDSVKAGETARDSTMRHTAYLTAIRSLEAVVAPLPGQRRLSVVVSWPVLAGHDFVAMLKSKDPLALVILGHYGVALHLYGEAWILAGLGRRLIEAMIRELDPEWRPHLSWAAARVAEPMTQPVSPL